MNVLSRMHTQNQDDDRRLRELGVIVEEIPCCVCGVVTIVHCLGFAAVPDVARFRCDAHTIYVTE